MKTSMAFILAAMLAVQAPPPLADGTVSPPDPVGEALWRSHLPPQLLPLVIREVVDHLGKRKEAVKRPNVRCPASTRYFILFGRHSRWLYHSITERGR